MVQMINFMFCVFYNLKKKPSGETEVRQEVASPQTWSLQSPVPVPSTELGSLSSCEGHRQAMGPG